jgi:hypothetical protein
MIEQLTFLSGEPAYQLSLVVFLYIVVLRAVLPIPDFLGRETFARRMQELGYHVVPESSSY